MKKTEHHSGKCDYCSNPAVKFSTSLSGEPDSLCDSSVCRKNHQESLDREHNDFVIAGLIPSAEDCW